MPKLLVKACWSPSSSKWFRTCWPACSPLGGWLGFLKPSGGGTKTALSPCFRFSLSGENDKTTYKKHIPAQIQYALDCCRSVQIRLQEGLETRVTVKRKVVNATATLTQVSAAQNIKLVQSNGFKLKIGALYPPTQLWGGPLCQPCTDQRAHKDSTSMETLHSDWGWKNWPRCLALPSSTGLKKMFSFFFPPPMFRAWSLIKSNGLCPMTAGTSTGTLSSRMGECRYCHQLNQTHKVCHMV